MSDRSIRPEIETTLKCPSGHRGPWRYVEQIEAYRAVGGLQNNVLSVSGRYDSGEGYDDGIPGTAYLECRFEEDPCRLCLERLAIPAEIEIEWVDPDCID